MSEAKQYTEIELQNLKKVQLEIFDSIVELCEKHNIEYVAIAGTVLGAVRHKGYIPWDDDIDIALLRDDYEKFLRIAKEELDEKFYVQNFETEKESIAYFTKIRKNGTLFVQDADKKSNSHQGIFVDVFPYDNLPDSNFKLILYRMAQVVLYQLYIAKSTTGMMGSTQNLKGKFKKVLRTILHVIAALFPKKYLYNSLDKLLRKYNGISCQKLMLSPEFASNGVAVPYDWVYPPIKCEFEGRMINVPCEYKKYLELKYGKDYMQLPPREKRFNHRPVELKF